MATLGGSIFAHNAIKYDYCIEQAIDSLCWVCDEVVAMDVESDDGTYELMLKCKEKNPNLKVVQDGSWECAENYARLAMLANKAKDHLSTKWHFMLQADEVIHEKSKKIIRSAIQNTKGFTGFRCRRINLFGSPDHYLRFDLPQDRKPCSDIVHRLGLREFKAVGDAESLAMDPKKSSSDYLEGIQIWHYGYVRDRGLNCDRVIDMQSWFHGKNSTPDQRVVECKKTTGKFDWTKFKERSDIAPIKWNHPRFSKEWARIRKADCDPIK